MTTKNLNLSGTTLVVGLGKSGLSAVRVLVAMGARVAVTDSRAEPPGLAELERNYPSLTRYLGRFDRAAFVSAEQLVVSPGVALSTPEIALAQARGVPVLGDVELFACLAKAPIAAITGSNGKSTVTTLLGMMAKQAGLQVLVGGNLGTPPLDLLTQGQPDLYVLELSSFQLETTSNLNAKVASVLNISPDHLDRYSDLAAYAQAKQRIFQGDGCQVLNADDAYVLAMTKLNHPAIRFTLKEPAAGEFGLRHQSGKTWLAYGTDHWLDSAELKISGRHNLANVLAALAMGQTLDLDRTAMLTAAREFSGLPHRGQLVAEGGGVRWINDSKATNVGATVAAVTGAPSQVVLIAGGEGKQQDFTPLRGALQAKARALVLIGRDAGLIEQAVSDLVLPVRRAVSLEQAVAVAAELAQPGDSVLLSPACASFDMFANYEARGLAFTAAAQQHAHRSC